MSLRLSESLGQARAAACQGVLEERARGKKEVLRAGAL